MRSRVLPLLLLTLCVVLATAGPAAADGFQTFSGNTAGGPTFNRPAGAGPGLSGAMVRYRAQSFRLDGPSDCLIYGSQDYDGYLHLYQGSFNPANPLNNLVDGDDDGELGIGSSRIPHDFVNDNEISLAGGGYVLVTSGFGAGSQGSYQNFIQCRTQQPYSGCGTFFAGIPADQQVCLADRFVVAIDQISNHPTDGFGTPVRFGSTDSGFFWFFNSKNFEVLIKVLNGCPVNGHWWVFFAGTTNQAHRIRVVDLQTLQIKTYIRGLGPPSPAETDTLAFSTCP